jgi:hypothetical protein
VLPAYEGSRNVAIHAVYASRRFLPAKVRVFIDYLADLYGPDALLGSTRPSDTARPVSAHADKGSRAVNPDASPEGSRTVSFADASQRQGENCRFDALGSPAVMGNSAGLPVPRRHQEETYRKLDKNIDHLSRRLIRSRSRMEVWETADGHRHFRTDRAQPHG